MCKLKWFTSRLYIPCIFPWNSYPIIIFQFSSSNLTYQMAPLLAKNIIQIIFLLFTIFSLSKAELHAHYYDQTCPQLEKIVSETVLEASNHDPKVPARILRMFFHDCFIRVCSLILPYKTHTFIAGEAL